MGLYNYWVNELPEPLNRKKCAICDKPMRPFNANPGLDAFQYVCKNCNSDTIIEFSGSLLSDRLYGRMRKDSLVKSKIKERIGEHEKERFAVLTTTISPYFT